MAMHSYASDFGVCTAHCSTYLVPCPPRASIICRRCCVFAEDVGAAISLPVPLLEGVVGDRVAREMASSVGGG